MACGVHRGLQATVQVSVRSLRHLPELVVHLEEDDTTTPLLGVIPTSRKKTKVFSTHKGRSLYYKYFIFTQSAGVPFYAWR